MATPVFPIAVTNQGLWGWPGLDWDVTKVPGFHTIIQKTVSGREARTLTMTAPLWTFGLTWECLRDDRAKAANNKNAGGSGDAPVAPQDEFRILAGFFLARRGAYEAFFFSDPTDRQVYRQQIGTGDGVTTQFQMIRTWGQGFTDAAFIEPVGGVQAISRMTVGGSDLSGGAYTINSPLDGWITFTTAPANAAAIVVDGTYYFKLRFLRDDQEFSNFMADFWKIRRVEMVTARP